LIYGVTSAHNHDINDTDPQGRDRLGGWATSAVGCPDAVIKDARTGPVVIAVPGAISQHGATGATAITSSAARATR
jgi:hypothetical protein